MKQNDIPYYYLFLYSKLKKKAWNNEYLDMSTIIGTIKKDCRQFPHNLIYHMLSQMEQYGLVKRIHKLKYKIIEKNIDCHGFDKGYLKNNEKKDDFQKVIQNLNKSGKVKCEDISLYKILPSKELNKLNSLNCWFVKE